MNLKLIDKAVMTLLLIADAIAIVIGMVAGPMGHTAVSMAASYSSVIVSVCLIVYFIILWKK